MFLFTNVFPTLIFHWVQYSKSNHFISKMSNTIRIFIFKKLFFDTINYNYSSHLSITYNDFKTKKLLNIKRIAYIIKKEENFRLSNHRGVLINADASNRK